jgi:hypothetical protein
MPQVRESEDATKVHGGGDNCRFTATNRGRWLLFDPARVGQMSGTPFGSGACCPQRADGITHVKVGPHGHIVGMMGLDTVFQQLYALDRRPEEATDAELVGMARKFNYIPNRASVEAKYAAALREAYRGFYSRQEQSREHTGR